MSEIVETEKTKTSSKSTSQDEIPNLQFVGKVEQIDKKTGKPEMVKRPAPKFAILNGKKIMLPDADKGIVLGDTIAAALMEVFPDAFKTPKTKGEDK
jgi:hypothetical protein